ncbi:MAG: N-acetyltransferase [Chloroflexi bacterium]|nr:N-acetyltransferase [Chloroflexota bacterium]
MTTPPFSLRDAIEADLPAVVAIYNTAVLERISTADTEPVTVQQRRAWFRAHDAKRRPIWVAEAGGLVVGWLSLQDFHERVAYSHTVEVSVYVAKDWRRRGVAWDLMEKAIEFAPPAGIRTIVALVFAHNAPSVGFFEGVGFQRWAHLPRIAEIDGVERDLLVFGLRLDLAKPLRTSAA